jgi:hypothetical protein
MIAPWLRPFVRLYPTTVVYTLATLTIILGSAWW